MNIRDPFDEPPKHRQTQRIFIGCSLSWFAWVLSLVSSKEQLAMALYLYRRCHICNSDTVTVPNDEVAQIIDLSRWGKRRALLSLAEAGILQVLDNGGWTMKVKLVWPDPPS
jgi:hypothetical protein